MRTTPVALAPGRARPPAGVLCPFALTAEPIARFLNCELDDPTYDGLELQYFDDTAHGRGLLAFLSRRADRLVDYYAEPGLALDPATFTVGGGVGAWTETTFDIARLLVADDGVNAEVRFTDVAGRVIEVRIDDRDGRPRRRAELLAPVGAAIDPPGALLLVYLHGFDLVRTGSATASIRIDGRVASPGRLPGVRLHRRHLIKHAAPLTAVRLNANHKGPARVVDPHDPGGVELTSGRMIAAVTAGRGDHRARLALDPALPDLASLPNGVTRTGGWTIDVDGARMTGGTWSALRRGAHVDLALEVTDPWRPGPLPPLMRMVTTLLPVFRRWPTTYRWVATVTLGEQPSMVSCWSRTTTDRGDAYRRTTSRKAPR